MTGPQDPANAPEEMEEFLNLATSSWRHDIPDSALLHTKLRYVASLLAALDAPVEAPSLLYQANPGSPVIQQEIGDSLEVGRNTEGGWSLPKEGRMSRTHFRVFRKDDAWWVEDAGSKNGTFLEGQPESIKTELIVSGDVIFAGGVRFALVLP